jgi:hypothetical protein
MDTSLILLQAMLLCAREYNPKNLLDWGERLTYGQQCDHLADKLKEIGYVLVKNSYPLAGEPAELTTHEGE